MALPAVRAVAEPDQEVLGVAHPRVLPLYGATGRFTALLPAHGAHAPITLLSTLRSFSPHRALVFTEAPSGAILAGLSGAGERMGRTRGPAGALLRVPDGLGRRDRPLWEEYLELAGAAGGTRPPSPDFRIDPGPEARERAHELAGTPAPVALAPGAAYGPAKRWPVERYAEVARSLAARGVPAVIVGSERERSLHRPLEEAGARDLSGRTNLLEAVAVLQQCRLLVTNDSGALHLARAAGTPVVAVFGSTSPAWTGPTAAEGDVITRGLPCSPCFHRRCPLSGADHLRCLREIEVPEVLAAVERRLEDPE
jgi:heptosyltransferase-2